MAVFEVERDASERRKVEMHIRQQWLDYIKNNTEGTSDFLNITDPYSRKLKIRKGFKGDPHPSTSPGQGRDDILISDKEGSDSGRSWQIIAFVNKAFVAIQFQNWAILNQGSALFLVLQSQLLKIEGPRERLLVVLSNGCLPHIGICTHQKEQEDNSDKEQEDDSDGQQEDDRDIGL